MPKDRIVANALTRMAMTATSATELKSIIEKAIRYGKGEPVADVLGNSKESTDERSASAASTERDVR